MVDFSISKTQCQDEALLGKLENSLVHTAQTTDTIIHGIGVGTDGSGSTKVCTPSEYASTNVQAISESAKDSKWLSVAPRMPLLKGQADTNTLSMCRAMRARH